MLKRGFRRAELSQLGRGTGDGCGKTRSEEEPKVRPLSPGFKQFYSLTTSRTLALIIAVLTLCHLLPLFLIIL